MEKIFIERQLKTGIKEKFFKGKAIILYGSRQVGKTTLIENILSEIKLDILYLNGDDSDTREMLNQPNLTKLLKLIGKAKIVFIDEAQRVSEIGTAIKIIVDRIKHVQVIVTGSSSFMLSESTKEPLTGRAYEFVLYPISFSELTEHHTFYEETRMLEHRLLYGTYPEICQANGEEKELLKLLTGSFLYRDLSFIERVSRPELFEKITKALALQIGSEVSYIELGQLVDADRLTVERYVNILEKAFIIFKLPALSKNVRNEIKKGRKIYFYDNGIRNAVIKNFNPLSLRNDAGSLWENYVISERIKYLRYNNTDVESFFWRTTQQQEIDYIEEREGRYSAYEFKLSPTRKYRFSKTFLESYKAENMKVVTRDNFFEFLMGEEV
jgi:hypothetical protein